MDCSLPGSSVHEISQARTLKWVAISFSRESFWCRDWTCVCCFVGGFFITEPSGKPGYHAERVWYSQTYPCSVARQSLAEITSGSFGWVKLSLFLTKPGPLSKGCVHCLLSPLPTPPCAHRWVCDKLLQPCRKIRLSFPDLCLDAIHLYWGVLHAKAFQVECWVC